MARLAGVRTALRSAAVPACAWTRPASGHRRIVNGTVGVDRGSGQHEFVLQMLRGGVRKLIRTLVDKQLEGDGIRPVKSTTHCCSLSSPGRGGKYMYLRGASNSSIKRMLLALLGPHRSAITSIGRTWA